MIGKTNTIINKEKEIIIKSGTYNMGQGFITELNIPHGIGKIPTYFGITQISLYSNQGGAYLYPITADANYIKLEGHFIGSNNRENPIKWFAIYIEQ